MPRDSDPTPHGKPSWLRKLEHETAEYLVVFAYMAAILLAFAIYNRAILAEYGVAYLPIAFGLLEAAILAKIVIIGEAFHLGHRFDGRPLAWTVLYRATIFALLTAVFSLVEEGVKRLLHHQKLLQHQPFDAPWAWDRAVAHAVILFVAFVPLFAIQELGKVIGPDKLAGYFFGERRRKAPGTKV
jgi:hypothetical protein